MQSLFQTATRERKNDPNWGKSRVPVYSLSLNSRRLVVAVLSARGEKARFRMSVTLGVILIRSLVKTKHIPGRLRSGSEVALE